MNTHPVTPTLAAHASAIAAGARTISNTASGSYTTPRGLEAARTAALAVAAEAQRLAAEITRQMEHA